MASSAIVLPITAVMTHYGYLLPGFAGLVPLPVTLIILVGAVALSSIVGGVIGNRYFEYKQAVGINDEKPKASEFKKKVADFTQPQVTFSLGKSGQAILSFSNSHAKQD